MIHEIVKLWHDYENFEAPATKSDATLATYIIDYGLIGPRKTKPVVIICPGGGYQYTSTREAEPVMIKYLSAGFNVFILQYSVASRDHFQPLLDLSRAVWMVRENAEKWNVNPDQIAVCGFSAGGHLAASLGVFWDRAYLKNAIQISDEMNKPNALILCYPVITTGEYLHRASFENLLGENLSSTTLTELSLENQVNEKTPPTFLWHTLSDSIVPVENSLLFAQKLRKYNISFELHIYPEGPHGMSICTEETAKAPEMDNPHVSSWMNLSIEWLKNQFK